jgi:uncharacterized membrane protein
VTDELTTTRLDRLEREIEELRRELARLRGGAEPPSREPEAAVVTAVEAEPRPAQPVVPAAPVRDELEASLTAAWRALERGEAGRALDEAFAALALVRMRTDVKALDELDALAAAAVSVTTGRTKSRAEQLVLRIRMTRTSLAGQPTPRAATPTGAAAPPPPAPPRKAGAPARRVPEPTSVSTDAPEPGPTVPERVAAWVKAELTGARAFAVVGGAVTLLGVVFFFVLAANRGWVGPTARVLLGAAASLVVLLAGLTLRLRYGRVHAALAAVGAGVAGAYTTLAAATVIYGFLPAWGALLVAAAIAAAGGAIAVAWSSQILAGLSLIGAAVAPGLVALDDGITWPGPAFALVVAVAAVMVAAPRRWLWLLLLVVGVATTQVAWLAFDAASDDPGAVAVVCAATFVLLLAATAWQAYGEPALDAATTALTFAAGGMALYGLSAVLPGDRKLGMLLLGVALVFVVLALAVRGRPEFAWTVGAVALLLGGVATAYLISGRSLTVVWSVEAAALAALGWKLSTPRFQAASIAYLVAAATQSLVVEIVPDWPDAGFDIPRGAALGLFALAVAALVAGVLQPQRNADPPARGIAAVLEPLWDGLVRARVSIRAALAVGAAAVLATALSAVLSGRWLTIVACAVAAAAGAAAFALGERRLQPFALGYLAWAVVHAVIVEAPPDTLAVERAPLDPTDPLFAVPSLVAIALAAAALAAFARFEDRGIPWLGAPAGVELALDVLRRGAGEVQRVLVLSAVTAGVWAAGLVAIDASFPAGQVVATALWALTGTAVVLLAARVRSSGWQIVGYGYVLLALGKAAFHDWTELGDTAATLSLLIAAAALFASGFMTRVVDESDPAPVELVSLSAGAAAAVIGLIAIERLLDFDTRAFGVAALVVASVAAVAGAVPYLSWRHGVEQPWLRTLANGYWAIALLVLLFAESGIVLRDRGATLALWAVTASVLSVWWRPLREPRAWVAALLVAAVAAVGTVALVVTPDALLRASSHPASGVWALAVVTAAAWVVAAATPPEHAQLAPWLLGGAAALTLYALSLLVLEAAERVSGASVTTDFQRGHTVLSALWGVGALALYVVGLATDRRSARLVGLTLFGLALAKLFLYDLASLSSITRAFSFLAVGAILMTAGFFAERLVGPGSGTSKERPT